MEALQAYEEAIKLNPNDAKPWNGIGNVYLELKRYDEAAS